MKKFAAITGLRISTNVIDGLGWIDVEVDIYYDSNQTYVLPQYRSSPIPEGSVHTVT